MSSVTEVKPVPTKSVDGDGLPWVPFAPYSDEVLLKYHHIDPVQGAVLVSMRIPAGMRLPTHYHTGIVIAHTIKGAGATSRRLGLRRAVPLRDPPGPRPRPRTSPRRRPKFPRDRRGAAAPRRRRDILAREPPDFDGALLRLLPRARG